MRYVTLTICALAFASTGCRRSTSPIVDGGAPQLSFVGRRCNVDSECGVLRCDPIRRQCICASDESCAGSGPDAAVLYCNNYTGLCVADVPGCKKDSDCPSGDYCDPAIRACQPSKAFCQSCSADNQCGGQGDRCLLDATLGQSFCARACATDANCVHGAACQSFDGGSLCWPASNPTQPNLAPSCLTFKGCLPDNLRTCNTNADCTGLYGQRCDPSSGKCIAIQQVCPFGTVCDPLNDVCVAECSRDSDCGSPTLRCINSACQPSSQCAVNPDCPVDRVCDVLPAQDSGTCVPFCQVDSDCPLGEICLQGSDGRFACTPGCGSGAADGGVSGGGCPLNQRCNQTTHQCEGSTVGSVQTCQANSVCGVCQVCDLLQYQCAAATKQFPYCAPCSPSTGNTDCPGGYCVQMADGNTYCAKSCTTNPICPNGFVCLMIGSGQNSACVPSDQQCVGKCL